MSKRGGKGRVSNELVAASCAAVLTVYAAGYWRTRDEARRIEAQAEERRAARPVAQVAAAPAAVPEVIQAPAAPPVIEPEPQPATQAEPVQAPVEKVAVDPPKKPVPKVATAPPTKPTTATVAESTPPLPSLDSVQLDLSPDPAKTPPPAPGPLPEGFQGWRDGTYTGWGQSYHGDIEAEVVIEGGRIVRSGIATCGTRYPCDVIWSIIFQPVVRQSADVDRVSRATESADAYYYGLLEALKQAEFPAEPAAAAPP